MVWVRECRADVGVGDDGIGEDGMGEDGVGEGVQS